MTLTIDFLLVGFICICIGAIVALLMCVELLAEMQEGRIGPVLAQKGPSTWSD